MNIFTASNITVTQNRKTYEKIMLSDEDINIILNSCRIGRHNHLVWEKPNVKKLSNSGKIVRTCARRDDALIIVSETENKGKPVRKVDIFVRQ